MTYYFRLQYRMLNRKIVEFGLPPWAGYGLAVLGFIGLSYYLLEKTEYASYFYVFIALSFLSSLSEPQRNSFLKGCFKQSDFYKIRLLENVLVSLPFVIFLLLTASWWSLVILLTGTLAMAVWSFNNQFNYAIPTPFGRYPFEFLVGFRKSYWMLPAIYGLTAIALYVGNFNLALFALAVVSLWASTFYSETENEYFVWIFALSPRAFLWNKLQIALGYCTLLSLPVIISLLLYDPRQWWIVLLIQLIGYLFVWTILLAKYAAYPGKISLPQGLLIAVGIWFPPVLAGVMIYFFQKSLKQLQAILS